MIQRLAHMNIQSITIMACSWLVFGSMTSAATINIPSDQPTIQAGIDAASTGDIILVAAGSYVENIDFTGKNIVVTSVDGAAATIIQAADIGLPVVTIANGEAKGVELSGFTITGSSNRGIYCDGSSPSIKKNIIMDNSSAGGNSGAGIDMRNTSGSFISDNTLHGNTAQTYGAAMHIGDNDATSTGDTVVNNVMYSNVGYGEIRVLGTVTGLQVLNNTISATGGHGIQNQSGSVVTAKNNIIFGSPSLAMFGGSYIAEYNCIFNNNGNFNFTPGTGNIFVDPQFVDIAANDYRLQSSSPCIDAGDPDPQFNDPNGSRNDMGAIPLGGPLGPQPPVLATIGSRVVVKDNNLSFDVTATDPNGTIPSLSATGLPAGATFADDLDGSATFDWTPDLTQVGLHNVTFFASDGTLIDSEIVSITVTDAPTVIHVPADQPTIQAGIDAALTGDTVLVAPGQYIESINFLGKSIVVLSSDGPLSTTISNGNAESLVMFDSGEDASSVLEGFRLLGARVAIYCRHSGPTIRGNILVAQTRLDYAALVLSGNSYGTIGNSPAVIVNNTIVNSANGCIAAWSTVPAVIKNNILAFSGHYAIHLQFPSVQPIIGYNDVFGMPDPYQNIFDPGIGTISADPMFNPDFTLSSSSPCIDAGDPDPQFNDPNGSRNDMGAVALSGPIGPQPPVLAIIGPQNVIKASNLSFDVTATDPNGTIPSLSATGLPSGATFTDDLDVSGTFDWTPNTTQGGVHDVTFFASDGVLIDSEIVSITVTDTPTVIHVPADQPTIQAGIDAALTGDTVLVAPGQYIESINFLGKSIVVLSSDGPLSTTISNGNAESLVMFDSGEDASSVLEGFRLLGARVAIFCRNSGPTIRRNLLVAQTRTNYAALVLSGATDGTIGNSPAVIENNTIVNSANGCIAAWSTVPAVIRNNILAFSAHYAIHLQFPSVQPVIGYNDVFGMPDPYQNIFDPGTGTISADPMFNPNFTLLNSSPCIDAGDPDPSFNDPDGTRNDMGALPGGFAPVPDTLINLIQWPVAEGGNDHWYAIIPRLLTWFDADSAASTFELEGEPGYLATIITPEENNFILDRVIAGTNQPAVLDQFWLGGSWFRTGSWGWDTGETFAYTNWAPDEPNNLPDESVMAIWGFNETDSRRPAGKWNNAPPNLEFCTCHIFWSVIEWGDNVSVCGDADGDGLVTWDDVGFLINHFFLEGPAPDPIELGDTNGNGVIDIEDIVRLSMYLYGISDSPCSRGPGDRYDGGDPKYPEVSDVFPG